MARVIECEGMTHAMLVQVAARWLRTTRGCGVVLTERGVGGETPDAIGWADDSIVVECKLSRADYLADLRKPWRQPGAVCLGRERWYLTPPGLFVAGSEVPRGWGLIVWNGRTVRRLERARPFPKSSQRTAIENRLLLSELHIYQVQGLTYRTIRQQQEDAAQSHADVLEARRLMGLGPMEVRA